MIGWFYKLFKNPSNSLIFVITLISFLFYLAIAFDVSPILRGPADYPPDWRWQYQFVNTFGRIWFPLIVIGLILFLFKKIEDKFDLFKKNERAWLVLLVVLSFLFQFSVLFFSRAGVAVLIHRIINPELNGYFTTATQIVDILSFLRGFEKNVLQFPMHAQGHPPGAVLLFWGINKIVSFFPFLNQLTNSITPEHNDVRTVWMALKPYEKTGAVVIAFLIPFLSALTVFPLYYCSKLLYGAKTALRSVCLFIFIPSIILFQPINDVFLPIFTTSTLLFIIYGFKSAKKYNFVIAGLIFSIGLFFSLSLLPLGLAFLILFILYSKRKNLNETFFLPVVLFALGFILLPLKLLLLFNFNFLTVSQTLMLGLPKFRAYQTWIFYNLYDFFIFCGISILVLFIYLIFKAARTKFKNSDKIFIAFTVMLLVLNFSGAVRGEVGRIWLPFVPFVVLAIASFTTEKLKLSTKQFILILILQAVQILIMQEFWVMLS